MGEEGGRVGGVEAASAVWIGACKMNIHWTLPFH